MSAVRSRHRPPAFSSAHPATAATVAGASTAREYAVLLGALLRPLSKADDAQNASSGSATRGSPVYRQAVAISRRLCVRPKIARVLPCREDPRSTRVVQIDCFSSLAARKATFLLALIWIGSPGAGGLTTLGGGVG